MAELINISKGCKVSSTVCEKSIVPGKTLRGNSLDFFNEF